MIVPSARERALDALAQHRARRGIADHREPASEPERRDEIRLHAAQAALDRDGAHRHADRRAAVRIEPFAAQQLVERVRRRPPVVTCIGTPGRATAITPPSSGRWSQASRMSRIWPRNDPLAGENAPSNTAEPIVNASTPASASAWIRSVRVHAAGDDQLAPGNAARAARTRSSGSASVAR